MRTEEERSIAVRRLAGVGFAAAMVAAPFLALIYGLGIGLLVMAVALGATAFLAFNTASTAEPAIRRRLTVLGGVNATLAILCAAGAIVRLA